MARPVYTHELTDPDFSWLLSNFQETHPNYVLVENPCLPLVFLPVEKSAQNAVEEGAFFAEETDEVDTDL